ncbi:hypothetical protein PtrSN002B_009816 [Pyrenophora tritici-repentis]|uniref:Uncharacterized protein n=1 Tax=Pyrenophora tritici-repentis TaxID=45151 RepID=A0A834VJF7_9PLEO|nr:hypothetical protein PtrM4_149210 [Pyrenophora tritici-repentis]KAI1535726.1 hypothetical protein PtrSN002B_009816 [Pyrenophora tritici-repentis]KAI1560445.1 hypothetical protein PtrEW7m1_011558 [Pyrenophora tritici-repentis]KAI1596045.1 hypothetical protein PtrCC142_009974 [Pyrenophora tritici-repentis]KAI2477370.1 basic-leucine zipper transcription factor [Pyrenophora tritici-repentis]
MQTPTAQDPNKPTIEMSLREHLLAAGAGQPTVQPLPQHSAHTQHVQHPHTTGPPHAIDPAIGGSYDMSAGGPDDGNSSEGRSKGRRELSTSKRAAQNRAAQVPTPHHPPSRYELTFASAHSVNARRNTSSS